MSETLFATGVSFNQPKLCPNATWNSNGTTFADNNTIGLNPQSIFVNTNNTVYAANYQNGNIQIWLEGSASPTTTLISNTSYPSKLFVSEVGDIYVSNLNGNNRIEIWRENASTYASTVSVSGTSYGFFVDKNDSLYYSLYSTHQVIKRSLNSGNAVLQTVAGTGCPGFPSDMLYNPRGIFVATNFDLYVADSSNQRIQRFKAGQVNGTTVAGIGAVGTITLSTPTAVMLDATGYLFIVDSGCNKIFGSGLDGFRCIIGCTEGSGSLPSQLSNPQSMAFDSYGNIFVVDSSNNRVQKFMLSLNSCSK